MSDTSCTQSRPQLAVVSGRKRSFGRVFERIKTVFRRRDNVRNISAQSVPTLSTFAQQHEPTLVLPASIAETSAITIEEEQEGWMLPDPSPELVVDDEDIILGSSDEPLISLWKLGRKETGLPEAKTRQLFERHGLTYHMRRPSDTEPAAKLRRVEKPVRMRVRWTCHSCSAGFGPEKICLGCGHQRCVECVREPSRKVKMSELKDSTQATTTALRPATAPPLTASAVIQSISAKHDNTSWQCTIQIGRPRVDSRLISLPPQCHECEHSFESGQTQCSNCQHQIRALCPASDRMHVPSMVPPVERVYKKPRQRVRYNCEFCNLQFSDREGCSGCGHERCENCPRFPPRKQKHVHDSTAWEALEAKIAAATTSTEPVVAESSASIESTPLSRL